eukprot:TRINITY_DN7435_c0_g1_i2.p1 TRINITY_DN7435_c0_g1~~TRINITY_DN7435_c0_g1_i2.p1  ORF type:complete len:3926 (-),score=589.68 TRINITY_DN7435_c0_g1_i2:12-11789(-)
MGTGCSTAQNVSQNVTEQTELKTEVLESSALPDAKASLLLSYGLWAKCSPAERAELHTAILNQTNLDTAKRDALLIKLGLQPSQQLVALRKEEPPIHQLPAPKSIKESILVSVEPVETKLEILLRQGLWQSCSPIEQTELCKELFATDGLSFEQKLDLCSKLGIKVPVEHQLSTFDKELLIKEMLASSSPVEQRIEFLLDSHALDFIRTTEVQALVGQANDDETLSKPRRDELLAKLGSPECDPKLKVKPKQVLTTLGFVSLARQRATMPAQAVQVLRCQAAKCKLNHTEISKDHEVLAVTARDNGQVDDDPDWSKWLQLNLTTTSSMSSSCVEIGAENVVVIQKQLEDGTMILELGVRTDVLFFAHPTKHGTLCLVAAGTKDDGETSLSVQHFLTASVQEIVLYTTRPTQRIIDDLGIPEQAGMNETEEVSWRANVTRGLITNQDEKYIVKRQHQGNYIDFFTESEYNVLMLAINSDKSIIDCTDDYHHYCLPCHEALGFAEDTPYLQLAVNVVGTKNINTHTDAILRNLANLASGKILSAKGIQALIETVKRDGGEHARAHLLCTLPAPLASVIQMDKSNSSALRPELAKNPFCQTLQTIIFSTKATAVVNNHNLANCFEITRCMRYLIDCFHVDASNFDAVLCDISVRCKYPAINFIALVVTEALPQRNLQRLLLSVVGTSTRLLLADSVVLLKQLQLSGLMRFVIIGEDVTVPMSNTTCMYESPLPFSPIINFVDSRDALLTELNLEIEPTLIYDQLDMDWQRQEEQRLSWITSQGAVEKNPLATALGLEHPFAVIRTNVQEPVVRFYLGVQLAGVSVSVINAAKPADLLANLEGSANVVVILNSHLLTEKQRYSLFEHVVYDGLYVVLVTSCPSFGDLMHQGLSPRVYDVPCRFSDLQLRIRTTLFEFGVLWDTETVSKLCLGFRALQLLLGSSLTFDLLNYRTLSAAQRKTPEDMDYLADLFSEASEGLIDPTLGFVYHANLTTCLRTLFDNSSTEALISYPLRRAPGDISVVDMVRLCQAYAVHQQKQGNDVDIPFDVFVHHAPVCQFLSQRQRLHAWFVAVIGGVALRDAGMDLAQKHRALQLSRSGFNIHCKLPLAYHYVPPPNPDVKWPAVRPEPCYICPDAESGVVENLMVCASTRSELAWHSLAGMISFPPDQDTLFYLLENAPALKVMPFVDEATLYSMLVSATEPRHVAILATLRRRFLNPNLNTLLRFEFPPDLSPPAAFRPRGSLSRTTDRAWDLDSLLLDGTVVTQQTETAERLPRSSPLDNLLSVLRWSLFCSGVVNGDRDFFPVSEEDLQRVVQLGLPLAAAAFKSSERAATSKELDRVLNGERAANLNPAPLFAHQEESPEKSSETQPTHTSLLDVVNIDVLQPMVQRLLSMDLSDALYTDSAIRHYLTSFAGVEVLDMPSRQAPAKTNKTTERQSQRFAFGSAFIGLILHPLVLNTSAESAFLQHSFVQQLQQLFHGTYLEQLSFTDAPWDLSDVTGATAFSQLVNTQRSSFWNAHRDPAIVTAARFYLHGFGRLTPAAVGTLVLRCRNARSILALAWLLEHRVEQLSAEATETLLTALLRSISSRAVSLTEGLQYAFTELLFRSKKLCPHVTRLVRYQKYRNGLTENTEFNNILYCLSVSAEHGQCDTEFDAARLNGKIPLHLVPCICTMLSANFPDPKSHGVVKYSQHLLKILDRRAFLTIYNYLLPLRRTNGFQNTNLLLLSWALNPTLCIEDLTTKDARWLTDIIRIEEVGFTATVMKSPGTMSPLALFLVTPSCLPFAWLEYYTQIFHRPAVTVREAVLETGPKPAIIRYPCGANLTQDLLTELDGKLNVAVSWAKLTSPFAGCPLNSAPGKITIREGALVQIHFENSDQSSETKLTTLAKLSAFEGAAVGRYIRVDSKLLLEIMDVNNSDKYVTCKAVNKHSFGNGKSLFFPVQNVGILRTIRFNVGSGTSLVLVQENILALLTTLCIPTVACTSVVESDESCTCAACTFTTTLQFVLLTWFACLGADATKLRLSWLAPALDTLAAEVDTTADALWKQLIPQVPAVGQQSFLWPTEILVHWNQDGVVPLFDENTPLSRAATLHRLRCLSPSAPCDLGGNEDFDALIDTAGRHAGRLVATGIAVQHTSNPRPVSLRPFIGTITSLVTLVLQLLAPVPNLRRYFGQGSEEEGALRTRCEKLIQAFVKGLSANLADADRSWRAAAAFRALVGVLGNLPEYAAWVPEQFVAAFKHEGLQFCGLSLQLLKSAGLAGEALSQTAGQFHECNTVPDAEDLPEISLADVSRNLQHHALLSGTVAQARERWRAPVPPPVPRRTNQPRNMVVPRRVRCAWVTHGREHVSAVNWDLLQFVEKGAAEREKELLGEAEIKPFSELPQIGRTAVNASTLIRVVPNPFFASLMLRNGGFVMLAQFPDGNLLFANDLQAYPDAKVVQTFPTHTEAWRFLRCQPQARVFAEGIILSWSRSQPEISAFVNNAPNSATRSTQLFEGPISTEMCSPPPWVVFETCNEFLINPHKLPLAFFQMLSFAIHAARTSSDPKAAPEPWEVVLAALKSGAEYPRFARDALSGIGDILKQADYSDLSATSRWQKLLQGRSDATNAVLRRVFADEKSDRIFKAVVENAEQRFSLHRYCVGDSPHDVFDKAAVKQMQSTFAAVLKHNEIQQRVPQKADLRQTEIARSYMGETVRDVFWLAAASGPCVTEAYSIGAFLPASLLNSVGVNDDTVRTWLDCLLRSPLPAAIKSHVLNKLRLQELYIKSVYDFNISDPTVAASLYAIVSSCPIPLVRQALLQDCEEVFGRELFHPWCQRAANGAGLHVVTLEASARAMLKTKFRRLTVVSNTGALYKTITQALREQRHPFVLVTGSRNLSDGMIQRLGELTIRNPWVYIILEGVDTLWNTSEATDYVFYHPGVLPTDDRCRIFAYSEATPQRIEVDKVRRAVSLLCDAELLSVEPLGIRRWAISVQTRVAAELLHKKFAVVDDVKVLFKAALPIFISRANPLPEALFQRIKLDCHVMQLGAISRAWTQWLNLDTLSTAEWKMAHGPPGIGLTFRLYSEILPHLLRPTSKLRPVFLDVSNSESLADTLQDTLQHASLSPHSFKKPPSQQIGDALMAQRLQYQRFDETAIAQNSPLSNTSGLLVVLRGYHLLSVQRRAELLKWFANKLQATPKVKLLLLSNRLSSNGLSLLEWAITNIEVQRVFSQREMSTETSQKILKGLRNEEVDDEQVMECVNDIAAKVKMCMEENVVLCRLDFASLASHTPQTRDIATSTGFRADDTEAVRERKRMLRYLKLWSVTTRNLFGDELLTFQRTAVLTETLTILEDSARIAEATEKLTALLRQDVPYLPLYFCQRLVAAIVSRILAEQPIYESQRQLLFSDLDNRYSDVTSAPITDVVELLLQAALCLITDPDCLSYPDFVSKVIPSPATQHPANKILAWIYYMFCRNAQPIGLAKRNAIYACIVQNKIRDLPGRFPQIFCSQQSLQEEQDTQNDSSTTEPDVAEPANRAIDELPAIPEDSAMQEETAVTTSAPVAAPVLFESVCAPGDTTDLLWLCMQIKSGQAVDWNAFYQETASHGISSLPLFKETVRISQGTVLRFVPPEVLNNLIILDEQLIDPDATPPENLIAEAVITALGDTPRLVGTPNSPFDIALWHVFKRCFNDDSKQQLLTDRCDLDFFCWASRHARRYFFHRTPEPFYAALRLKLVQISTEHAAQRPNAVAEIWGGAFSFLLVVGAEGLPYHTFAVVSAQTYPPPQDWDDRAQSLCHIQHNCGTPDNVLTLALDTRFWQDIQEYSGGHDIIRRVFAMQNLPEKVQADLLSREIRGLDALPPELACKFLQGIQSLLSSGQPVAARWPSEAPFTRAIRRLEACLAPHPGIPGFNSRLDAPGANDNDRKKVVIDAAPDPWSFVTAKKSPKKGV